MNCEAGDIARVVGYPEHAHRLFEVLELVAHAEAGRVIHIRGRCWMPVTSGPIWWVRACGSPLPEWGTHEGPCEDSYLRPIRDQGGEDEILRLVGKPEGVTA